MHLQVASYRTVHRNRIHGCALPGAPGRALRVCACESRYQVAAPLSLFVTGDLKGKELASKIKQMRVILQSTEQNINTQEYMGLPIASAGSIT